MTEQKIQDIDIEDVKEYLCWGPLDMTSDTCIDFIARILYRKYYDLGLCYCSTKPERYKVLCSYKEELQALSDGLNAGRENCIIKYNIMAYMRNCFCLN